MSFLFLYYLLISDNTLLTDKNLIELDSLSEFVSKYDDEHCPIKYPSLIYVIKLRMYEMGLNQMKLSGGGPLRCSDYLIGRCEPTLKVVVVLIKILMLM